MTRGDHDLIITCYSEKKAKRKESPFVMQLLTCNSQKTLEVPLNYHTCIYSVHVCDV